MLEKRKKNMGYESDGDNNRNCRAQYTHQRIDKGTRGLGNKRMSGDHTNYTIVGISLKNKKSPGDLWRFAPTQTRVENHAKEGRLKRFPDRNKQ